MGRAEDARGDRARHPAHGRHHRQGAGARPQPRLPPLGAEGAAGQDQGRRGAGEEKRHRGARGVPRRGNRADAAADPVQGGEGRDRLDDGRLARAIVGRQKANEVSIAELQELVGKSREAAMQLWAKVSAEKTAYTAALAEYKVNLANFSAKRAALMDMLSAAKMDKMLA